jgi:signal transduction histidine kinase
MIPRLKLRLLLLFEAAVIASMIGVGWALFHTYGVVDDLTRQRASPSPKPTPHQVQQVRMLEELRGRYLTLADRLENGFRLIREGLEAFLKDRTVSIGRYLREAENLQQGLADGAKVKETAEARQVWSELLATPLAQAETTLDVDLNYHEFLAGVMGAVSNHLATLNITEGQPLSSNIVQLKITKARHTERVVASLITDAFGRAERLGRLLDQHSTELLTPAVSPISAVRRAKLESTLQLIMTLLAGVFLLQAIVVIAAFYRRFVVLPLHQRIIENTTSAEFQRKLDHFARLATGLAHEIRNPLTAINIRLFTLQKSFGAGGSQHADTVLIRNEIDRLEQILKNFLRLARPSEPKLARLTARPLLDETHDLLSAQCRQKGVELRVEKATNTPFLGDAVQLKQVLINLVQNAAESIEGSGRVTLRAYDNPGQNQGLDEQRKAIVLEVEDTGCGITPEVQERLFDPFFSTKENGTGLGLPIAAKIVDHHMGRLEFETRSQQGAIFRVILPVDGELKSNG